ncbi:hypothetical protein J5N97_015872 [Dioscorea zingiberensis]|uniref:Uncharacterized protein n=1 Tax=Dioscorea zingiberensis TaxID=325984 RepID=A0A9D5HF46_9LILI|nr:hypothetical protein J5N97_015872 [Dioscorea zingiberensis]
MMHKQPEQDKPTCLIADQAMAWAFNVAKKNGLSVPPPSGRPPQQLSPASGTYPNSFKMASSMNTMDRLKHRGNFPTKSGIPPMNVNHLFGTANWTLNQIRIRAHRQAILMGGAARLYRKGYHRLAERIGRSNRWPWGMVVEWSPQQEVLAHPAVSCFMSHCGWNSTMEGVSNGVPFLCWPCFGDQHLNQTYICDVWKIGLKMNPDENNMITKEQIKDKVEELLDDGEMKKRALAMKEIAFKGIEKGGSSFENFNTFISAMQV